MTGEFRASGWAQNRSCVALANPSIHYYGVSVVAAAFPQKDHDVSTRPPVLQTGILLVVMVALLMTTGYLGYKALTAPIKKASPPCDSQTVTGSLTTAQVGVRVYNAGTKDGAAKSIGEQLKGKGFMVLKVGNSSQTVEQTIIIGSKIDAPEVKLVAAFFPQSKLQEDGRTDHTVDVIFGDSFAGLNDTAPTQIAVESAVICANQTPTPKPSVTVVTPTPTETPTPTPTG